jgi:hypothetical protein
VTLTATESAADGTLPAGSVQFGIGGTNIGAAVAVNASGVATTTTTFAAIGTDALSAQFTPAGDSYAYSTGTLAVTVTSGTVNLTAQSAPLTATGTLQDVTVTDTRNYVPGWSVSGQESVFTGSGSATGSTMSGDQLGWVPEALDPLVGGAALGPLVAPGTSPGGLGDTAAVLADADAGSGLGTNTLSADLTLDIPATALAGPYSGEITITYLDTGPQVAGTIGVGVNL